MSRLIWQYNRIDLCFKGKAVSRGIGIGKIVRLQSRRRFYQTRLSEGGKSKELRRFRAAVRLAKRQLRKLVSRESSSVQRGIFEAQIFILEDREFIEKIESKISEGTSAELAIREIANRYIILYKEIQDEAIREKYIDVEDVSDRILSILNRSAHLLTQISEDTILVIDELKPSVIVEFGKKGLVKGVISESGGWTSHAFIIARELGIPAVTGLQGFSRLVVGGETAVVNGYDGEVILFPSEETIKTFSERVEKKSFSFSEFQGNETKTLDGKVIEILVNLDFVETYENAKKLGAKGVGLYRSEFLFNQRKGFPSELEQFEVYKKIVESVGEDRVKIRTFDLNAEGFSEQFHERNPALGLRAIRLGLTYEREFRKQIRALLRASAARSIDVVLPMISDISEILKAKKILREEREKLVDRKVRVGELRLGIMVEVPSAVFMIEEFLAEVDFVNLGTNDLVQYILAVDRDNESVSDWFRTLHPAVIRAIDIVLRKAEETEKEVVVCGEMAGSPVYVPILVGLGATRLSMNVNSIARIRHFISNIAYEEAYEVARKVLQAKSADEAEEIVHRKFTQNWRHLFPSEFFPKGKS
ncbi:MAG: phosphoenolpyruvate--protein phosphotransferase [Pyrinomonadaceae bacterium]|nr:phosphoenolpyruvate--protein phosphotransferase [Pyrinomonadaceae bacterium]MCX7639723.1 phosphoenolpyruvate--protein phosphotransferase [Pyrinomonadaceae bacterium]MDW8304306.1 phosphoenolpyruvate--protein phosphotransferase [Acidobacteriota bacterium]